MKAGAGLSTHADARSAAAEASLAARPAMEGAQPDLAVVVASPHHAARAAEVLEAVHEAVTPGSVIGCVAEAVIGGAREVEEGPAISVWLASLPAPAETFHMGFVPTDTGGTFAGWGFDERPGEGVPPSLVIADPYTFPADTLLGYLNEHRPGAVVVGGMAGAGSGPGETVLFQDREVIHEGAVGARLPGAVSVRALVSQGCRPFGRSYVVTRSQANFLFELGGRPPLNRLEEALESLSRPDRELASQGLHIGRVIDEYKSEHGPGDFLIRGVLGVDPQNGAMAVGDRIEVGATVQFHVRDAATADDELRSLVEREVANLPGKPAGALLFTCNGRGARLFGAPDHDAALITSLLGGAPLAGLFCAGELGPVGGRNFLHGFTASLLLFVDGRRDEPAPGGAV